MTFRKQFTDQSLLLGEFNSHYLYGGGTLVEDCFTWSVTLSDNGAPPSKRGR
jgi:hypothetical protein